MNPESKRLIPWVLAAALAAWPALGETPLPGYAPKEREAPAQAPAQATPPAQPAEPGASQGFTRLAEDYWETLMRLNPLWATFVNHPRYHDRLHDLGAAGREKERAELSAILGRLWAVDRAALSESERVSAEVMEWQLRMALEREAHRFHEWDVDHMDGPQTWIATVIEFSQPMKTAEDAEALLKRMAAMPKLFADHAANLRAGLASGRVPARIAVEKTIAQIESILKTPPDQTPYAAAARRLPAELQGAYLPRVLAAVEEHAFAGERAYLESLRSEALPRSRPTDVGLSFLPGGRQAYRFQIRFHTTLDKTPEELHRTGLEELEAIHGRMKAIAERMGHSGDLRAFMEKVRRDPTNFFAAREEVLAAAEALVAKAKSRLGDYFGALPKTDLVVKPIEEYKERNDVAARYFSPPNDLSRPGIYFINTYDPPTRPRFSMASLAAHEGVPGHHLQIALALEQRGLPDFRRHAGFSAYVEGWALYSELLGEEMGLYDDDLSRVGMLSDQALRACRLVVDTGLHSMGWSRERAIAFMKDNTPMSEHEIVAEVDRYIIWPGQALAYKVGQREILALREALKVRQGQGFDLKAFHDRVLRDGAVPLETLRRALLRG